MSVEDTDFSPPTTAVMFLLTIHPTTLEAEDFLSTGVKIQNPPAVPAESCGTDRRSAPFLLTPGRSIHPLYASFLW